MPQTPPTERHFTGTEIVRDEEVERETMRMIDKAR
jgi:hypothetical protein